MVDADDTELESVVPSKESPAPMRACLSPEVVFPAKSPVPIVVVPVPPYSTGIAEPPHVPVSVPKAFVPDHVLLLERIVELAAVMVISEPPLKEVPLMRRAFCKRVAVEAFPVSVAVRVERKLFVPLHVLLLARSVVLAVLSVGVTHVPSPRQKVVAPALVPLFK